MHVLRQMESSRELMASRRLERSGLSYPRRLACRGIAACTLAVAILAGGAFFADTASAQETWVVGPGKDLRAQLEDWSNTAGWTLIWQTPAYDISLDSGVALRGNFEEAIVSLLEGIPAADAVLYQGNKTLVVTIKGSAEK